MFVLCTLLFFFVYVQTIFTDDAGGDLAHSGTRRIEFLEEPDHDVWEINLATQTLYFTGLVRITTLFAGYPTCTSITRETVEIMLPLERLHMALHDFAEAPHGPVGPEPQEPFVPPVVDPVGVAENGAGEDLAPVEEDPEEYLEEGEFIGGDPNGHA